jgi:hypothetical protein
MASFSETPTPPRFVPASVAPLVQIRSTDENLLEIGEGELVEAPFGTGLGWFASDAIVSSGWVASTDDSAAADLRVHVVDLQRGGVGLLSLLTAYLIPGFVDHHIEVRVSLGRANGVARCVRSAELRVWYQTFLIIVYPFKSPNYARIKTTEALALGCLAEILAGSGPGGR